MNDEKTIGIDYEKEYLRLSIENNKLRQENEELKNGILSMVKVYTSVDAMNDIFKDIERELKIISRKGR